MKQSTRSILLAMVAVLSWSTVATAFKIALKELGVFDMLLIACVTSLAIFGIMMTVEGKWRHMNAMSPRLIAGTALLGILNPVIYYLVLFKAYDMLPAQVAQPLNYTWPIALLVMLALFDRQPIPALKYVGMALSIGGVACISLGSGAISGNISGPGIAVALASAILWATYWLFNNRLKDKVDSTVGLFIGFLAGTIVLAIATCFVGIEIPSSRALWSGVYIGCFEMGIPFFAFGMALRLTKNPTLVNQLCYLSPFLSLFIIATVLHESIMPTTYIGLALIVAGLLFNQYVNPKPLNH